MIRRDNPDADPIDISPAGHFLKLGQDGDWEPFCQLCTQVLVAWIPLKKAQMDASRSIVVGQKRIILPGQPEYRG